jgi:type VI secretion system protein ImpF
LTNPDLIKGDGVGMTMSSEVERLKDEVRRDLEWLLNTRRSPIAISPGMTGLKKSLVTYGLPDLCGITATDSSERDRLVKLLESVIRDFEPRLADVQVSFNPLDQDKTRSSLHYRINGMLRIDPAPEAVVFNTVLELGNRTFTVKSDGT